MAKCDLQVHSKWSDRPSEWLLRRFGVPESYTSPQKLYDKAKAAGMDFVTITDHNTVGGCLEIADKPGVFLSEEVTSYFSDGVKVHILVWGLSEAQHTEIQEIRRDIRALSIYLRSAGLAHGVAHPLFSVDDRLTVDHVEQLILMFRVFEGLNGLRNPVGNEVAQICLNSLTLEKIAELSDRHHLQPYGPEPWKKILTGGSDDHGGLFIARAYTETGSAAATPAEFLEAVMRGDAGPRGESGSPQTLASGIYSTAHHFIRDYLNRKAPLTAELSSKMFERFLAGQNPTAFSFGEKVNIVAESLRSGQIFSILTPGASIPRDLAEFFNQPALRKKLEAIQKAEPTAERRTFLMASEISNYLGFRFFDQMVRQIGAGDFLGSLQSASAMVPVFGTVTPYVVAFHSLYHNRPLLEQLSSSLLTEKPRVLQNVKRAWLTDTLEDVNGVARTIRTMSRQLRAMGKDITVITSRSAFVPTDDPIKNFKPVGEFELPEYKLQKLSFPPVLEMLDYIARENFSEIIISTPGPVGLVGLAAAKMFGLRVCGIYHTDFPQYVKILSDDVVMETLTWNYMHWFYGQLDTLYSNSKYYLELWKARGISERQLRIFPRGLDTDLFNTKHREGSFWKKRGAKHPVALYVGRISKEKDLDLMPAIAREMERLGHKVSWVFVGDGPYREELSKLMPKALFTGILTGLELGKAYASADAFIFPSTTDTYGNVIVEACAAGLPVVVSDLGGPKELVRSGVPGYICARGDAAAFAEGVAQALRRGAGKMPTDLVSLSGWDRAAEAFWEGKDL